MRMLRAATTGLAVVAVINTVFVGTVRSPLWWTTLTGISVIVAVALWAFTMGEDGG